MAPATSHRPASAGQPGAAQAASERGQLPRHAGDVAPTTRPGRTGAAATSPLLRSPKGSGCCEGHGQAVGRSRGRQRPRHPDPRGAADPDLPSRGTSRAPSTLDVGPLPRLTSQRRTELPGGKPMRVSSPAARQRASAATGSQTEQRPGAAADRKVGGTAGGQDRAVTCGPLSRESKLWRARHREDGTYARGHATRAPANPMNPMVGCGMQQARGPSGCANRQGGEKPRSRNQLGRWHDRAWRGQPHHMALSEGC
jgi:hypothetical protein